jgi:hypothetical protein
MSGSLHVFRAITAGLTGRLRNGSEYAAERLQEMAGLRNANWNHHDGERCFNVNLNQDAGDSKLGKSGREDLYNGNPRRSFPQQFAVCRDSRL